MRYYKDKFNNIYKSPQAKEYFIFEENEWKEWTESKAYIFILLGFLADGSGIDPDDDSSEYMSVSSCPNDRLPKLKRISKKEAFVEML